MRSDIMKKGLERAPHRALMTATGIKHSDITKPYIGVCNSYTNIVPGHCHLKKSARSSVTPSGKPAAFLTSSTRSPSATVSRWDIPA